MSALGFALRSTAAVLLLAAGLSGCAAGPSAPVVDPVATDTTEPAPVSGPRPAWYGDDVDGRGCPVPPSGAPLAVFDVVEKLLGIPLPNGWCAYRSVTYSQYYLIPSTIDPGFPAQVRELLGPVGWAFDAADDDSPHWSWINDFPESALQVGFPDPDIDGAILFSTALTEDEGSSRQLWFGPLISTFADFELAGYVAILGF